MRQGERFAVEGYDIVAAMQAAEGGGSPDTGEAIVLNNNSTHYLVACREPSEPSAIFLESYAYHGLDEGHIYAAYVQALAAAFKFAVSH